MFMIRDFIMLAIQAYSFMIIAYIFNELVSERARIKYWSIFGLIS